MASETESRGESAEGVSCNRVRILLRLFSPELFVAVRAFSGCEEEASAMKRTANDEADPANAIME